MHSLATPPNASADASLPQKPLGIVQARIERRCRAFIEAAPDALIIVTPDGRIVVVNARAETITGYPRQELLGESVEILFPERFRPAHQRSHRALFSDGEAHHVRMRLDLYVRRKNGTEFAAEISSTRVETEDGTFVISAVRDMTRHRATLDLLRNGAHELNNALASVPSNAALLRTWAVDADAAHALQTIEQSTQRVAAIIRQLREFARAGETSGGNRPDGPSASARLPPDRRITSPAGDPLRTGLCVRSTVSRP